MLAGRFILMWPTLALAGAFAEQRCRITTEGLLPTESVTFAVLLVAMIVIMAGLSFLPLLALGPIVEHLMLWR
jgi:K+-transporting ATPase ATPase A chain